jgi:signal peptidase I
VSGSEQEAASGERDLGQAVRSDAGSEPAADGASGNAQGSSAPEDQPGTQDNADGKDTADGQDNADGQDKAGAPGAEAAASSDGETPDSGSGSGREQARRRRKRRSFWRELPVLVVVALLLAVVIKTYAVQAFFIPSGSMENTLLINDRVLVNKIVYDIRGIHRGDIVVFNGDGSWAPGQIPTKSNFIVEFGRGFASMFGFGHPGDILIKRVMGLPGDRVACCDAQGRVTVNGVPLSERSYLFPGDVPSESRFDIVVPPGRLWVMGDHRFISDDSRDHVGEPGGGTVPESAVIGRAFVIIWPPSRWRILPIPATFEQPKLNASSATPATGGTDAATLLPGRLEPAGPALPLSLGFAAAIPLTLLQRRIRLRAARRRRRRSTNASHHRGQGRP